MPSIRPFRAAALLSLTVALPVYAAGPTVWSEGMMVKVRPGTAARSATEVRLTAARNEFVSFQVALHGGDAGLKGVRAKLPALEGPGSTALTGPDVTLYRQALVTTKQASVAGEPVGAWPDGLVPDTDEIAGETRRAFPFDVPAKEARALWVDVHVPEDAPPGDYTGTVTVEADGGFQRQVTARLTVVDAVLPSTSSLSSAFLLWPPHVCRAHTGREDCTPEELQPLLTRYQRMALEHRFTLSSLFPRKPWPPEWSNFDATWGPYLEGTAPNRLQGARMTSLEYVGPLDAANLKDFTAHMKQKGWLDRAYVQLGDEPPYGTSFEQVHATGELVRKAAPGLRTMLTTNSRELKAHGLEDAVDTAVPLVNHLDGTDANFRGDQRGTYTHFLERPGAALWMYQSCMSHGCAYGTNAPENKPGAGWPSYMLDRSAAKARAMEWVTFLQGATGELYYQTVGMLSTAWRDQYRFNGNGDGTLFYPGTPEAIGGRTDVPVASLRLKLIRQGMQDYEWLKAVADAGDPGFARKVARDLIPAASRVTDDGAAFDAARLKLIQRYEELTATQTPDAGTQQPDAGTQQPTDGGKEPMPEEAAGGPSKGTPGSTSDVTLDALDDAQAGGCTTGGGGTAAVAGGLVFAAWALGGMRRRHARVTVPARRR
ncbi:DUF4091 domain-containing protein [Corallococcus sp. AS-1-6]|uniref:DUF4091 domain-containing protein n=1 Tax=Corallococcus sp. AS-1-6 TaxID=2874599 RepID=UPI001CC1BDC7|nr:DUF4091 domain-containing protein [Corallococcus sp. AS-1-6]MBZ4375572.1 DUF4091 domain-containing protein [Corallococcus sp. AS-1-6]